MNWRTIQEYDHGVEVRLTTESNPNLVAIFDEGKKVTEPTSAIQSEDVCWEAVGYSEAKARYSDEIDDDTNDACGGPVHDLSDFD